MTTFSTKQESEKKQDINSEENNISYAGDCVEFLDSLPFDSDELDEDDLDYYDKVINI